MSTILLAAIGAAILIVAMTLLIVGLRPSRAHAVNGRNIDKPEEGQITMGARARETIHYIEDHVLDRFLEDSER